MPRTLPGIPDDQRVDNGSSHRGRKAADRLTQQFRNGGIRPGSTADAQLVGDQLAKAGAAGQVHHRDQPGGADQVGFIEAGGHRSDLAELHLADGLLFGVLGALDNHHSP